MFDDVIRQLPLLTVVGTGMVSISVGVWKIARWTTQHDSRVERLETWKEVTDTRLTVVESKTNDIQVALARLEVRS
jgi:hypothetical protein